MRRLNVFDGLHTEICPTKVTEEIRRARHIQTPFSDGDILELEDLFLNTGVHYIKVDDIKSGRKLINLFLHSLNCYHNVACLSISPEPLDSSVLDLYAELMVGGYLDKGATQRLEEFFLDQFEHDFLWLEVSEHVLKSHWMGDLLRQIKNFKLDQLLPILIVSYQKE